MGEVKEEVPVDMGLNQSLYEFLDAVSSMNTNTSCVRKIIQSGFKYLK